ncbi:MAG: PHP domain-containing protein, partial [Acidimicrobiales bacterium]|nr:PHP domain-containing protein [Acidimicrobiales bacterium]
MSWFNPPISWSEIERRLSDRPPAGRPQPADRSRYPGADGGDSPAWSNKRQAYEPPSDRGAAARGPADGGRGGDGHTGSPPRRTGSVPYAELHCHSNFSFLDGASHPEELAEEADRLGLEALALTDHDGCYGIVRFAEAARALGLPTVFGSELTLGRTAPQPGVADPGVPEPGTPGAPRATRGRRAGQVALAGLDLAPGLPDPGRCLAGETHLVVLARDPRGYALLARAASEAQLRG